MHALTDIWQFFKRQKPDWKVTVARSSLERFGYQMILPYLSIYIVALGATKTELGLVNSIGILLAGLIGPYTGILIDRTGPKKIYLLGIGMLMSSYLIFGLAQNWIACMLAMGLYWIGQGSAGHSCATVCGNSLANRDRARGMTLCETIAAGVLGIAAPMVGAFLIEQFGGVNVAGIRPLFFVAFAVSAFTFVLVWVKLSDKKWSTGYKTKANLLMDAASLLKGNRTAQKWLVIGALNKLPQAMVIPFTQVFAQELKGASGYILGAMVTGMAVTSIVFGLPAGMLADRIGRKKTLYMLIPLLWASNLLLIWAPSPLFLVLAGVLLGFANIIGPVSGAIEMELFSAEEMGRWIGINRLVKAIFGAAMAFIAGLIWDGLGPQYVFLIYVGIDLVLRIPLLISMPETLQR